MDATDTQEFEELLINSVAGLQAFLQNAQAQYNFGLAKETELVAEGIANQSDQLHHAFQTVRNTANKLIVKAREGEEITDADAFSLQENYDELVRIVLILKQQVNETKQVHTSSESQIKSPNQIVSSKENNNKANKKSLIKKDLLKKREETNSVLRPKSHDYKTEQKLKPKTGRLTIASEDQEVVDIKKQVLTDFSKKNKSTKKTFKGENNQKIIKNKLYALLKHCQISYSEVKKKYPEPNAVQNLLLEEAREGIEHLELIAKSTTTPTPLSAISEVASHVKFALEGVHDSAHLETPEKKPSENVPIVTKFVSPISNTTKTSATRVSFVPTSITTTKPSVVSRSIPKQLQKLPKPDDIHKRKSLTKMFLFQPKYQRHIDEHYSSPAGFEQLLDATITKIESDSIDSLERWLGDLPASAFAFLEDMTTEEVVQFGNRSYKEVTTDLQKENVKYETFVSWRDLIDEMLEMVSGGKKMKFGQLFAVWMVESDIQMSQ